METTTKNSVSYTYNSTEIVEQINKTIEKIEKEIEDNDYQVKGNLELYKNQSIRDLSKTKRKKIQKYCFWINEKPTLRRINTFLGFLSRYFKIERATIKVSLKEETIQKARKEWIKCRNESERLLKIYKEEKGDFYKK